MLNIVLITKPSKQQSIERFIRSRGIVNYITVFDSQELYDCLLTSTCNLHIFDYHMDMSIINTIRDLRDNANSIRVFVTSVEHAQPYLALTDDIFVLPDEFNAMSLFWDSKACEVRNVMAFNAMGVDYYRINNPSRPGMTTKLNLNVYTKDVPLKYKTADGRVVNTRGPQLVVDCKTVSQDISGLLNTRDQSGIFKRRKPSLADLPDAPIEEESKPIKEKKVKEPKPPKEKKVKEPKPPKPIKEKPVKEPKPIKEKPPKPIKEKPIKEPKPIKEKPIKEPKPLKVPKPKKEKQPQEEIVKVAPEKEVILYSDDKKAGVSEITATVETIATKEEAAVETKDFFSIFQKKPKEPKKLKPEKVEPVATETPLVEPPKVEEPPKVKPIPISFEGFTGEGRGARTTGVQRRRINITTTCDSIAQYCLENKFISKEDHDELMKGIQSTRDASRDAQFGDKALANGLITEEQLIKAISSVNCIEVLPWQAIESLELDFSFFTLDKCKEFKFFKVKSDSVQLIASASITNLNSEVKRLFDNPRIRYTLDAFITKKLEEYNDRDDSHTPS